VARDVYLKHLASIPLFASCHKRHLEEIAQVADEVVVESGAVLVRQGDVGMQLFIILDGTATATRDGARIATLGPGDFVGELAVLERGRRNATVTADSSLTVLVLTAAGLNQLLDDVPGLAKALLFAVAGRVAASDGEMST
jgi:CRP/FNR family transcriptional regulator, cyclic AMP receptor protein